MKKSKAMCDGCYNNDYNNGLGGAKECWSYPEAEIKQRMAIHVSQPPPYDKNFKPMMSCYRKPQFVFVEPSALRDDGYWKN